MAIELHRCFGQQEMKDSVGAKQFYESRLVLASLSKASHQQQYMSFKGSRAQAAATPSQTVMQITVVANLNLCLKVQEYKKCAVSVKQKQNKTNKKHSHQSRP